MKSKELVQRLLVAAACLLLIVAVFSLIGFNQFAGGSAQAFSDEAAIDPYALPATETPDPYEPPPTPTPDAYEPPPTEPAPPTATITPTVPTSVAIGVEVSERYGRFLTADRMSLYTFDEDEPEKSNCGGRCAEAWPPLLLADGQQLAGEANLVSKMGTILRPDGVTQVTFMGQPLYFFVEDQQPGDTFGEGVGGVWHLVRLDASATPTAEPTMEPTAMPTDEPTAVPTDEPTAVPTDEPTAVPTMTAVPPTATSAPPTMTPTSVPPTATASPIPPTATASPVPPFPTPVVDEMSVESFTLIDADTDQPVANYDPIPEGAMLDLSMLPANLNIRANVTGEVESVRFWLEAPRRNRNRIENVVPYALAGDSGGDYRAQPFRIGQHTVTAVPYSENRARGTAGEGATLNFVVTAGQTADLVVTSFTLIDARTDEPVPGFDPIPADAIIDMTNLGLRRINIRANVAGEPGSVRFYVNDLHWRTENSAPFALAGDRNGNYRRWWFTPGQQTITAVPYAETRARGVEGLSYQLTFTVQW